VSYIYNHFTGSVNYLPGPAASAYVAAGQALGWHGPFDTEKDVTDFFNSQTKAHPDWKAPTGFKGVVTNAVADVTGLPINKDGYLGLPNWDNWILRIAEILVGIVLLGVGVAHMSGNKTNIIVKALKVGNK
jgi:hypothetical protein